MATEDDDDPLREWGLEPAPRTTLDERPPELLEDDRPTAPHQVLGAELAQGVEAVRDASYLQGLKDGREEVFAALDEVFAESPGGLDAAARAATARVRSKLAPI